jgi:hypothetical protein
MLNDNNLKKKLILTNLYLSTYLRVTLRTGDGELGDLNTSFADVHTGESRELFLEVTADLNKQNYLLNVK